MANFESISVGTSISARCAEAKRICRIINDQKLKYGNLYTPWIRFEIGGLVIDTADPNNHYFMSLDYVKNGSGSANSFTICLGYEPKPPNLFGRIYDPSLIDKAIAKSATTTDKSKKLKCVLQYGYSLEDGNKLVHPKTEGMLTDYNVEIRDGLLYYTLTGYTSVIKTVDKKISVEAKQNVRPTNVAKEILEQYLRDEGYEIQFGENTENTDTTVEKIDEVNDKSIWEYVDYVLSFAVPEGVNNDSTESETRPYYTYNIIEDEGHKVIQIISVNVSDNDTNNSSSSSTLFFTFNWMDKGDNMVNDFQTQYKGIVALSGDYLTETSTEESQYGIDDMGEIVETQRTKPALVVDSKENEESENTLDKESASDKNTWAKATQYSYKATLTTVGIPADIPITARVEVIPLIYGVAHHTAGKYMVTKCVDRIDSGGYQTSMDLIKITSDK